MERHQLWPSRPTQRLEESFSSWFTRLSLANGLSASELYRAALPGARLYRADQDRNAPEGLIAELACRTDITEQTLRGMTFRRWHSSLVGDDDGHRKLPWLPAAASWASKQSYGQQYCPMCLAGDEVPYFRLHWRLAFTTVCAEHGVLFLDRCPACAAAVQPMYCPPNVESAAICWRCGFDLRRAETDEAISVRAIGRESRYLRALHDNWYAVDGIGPLHSVIFFALLWRIYRLTACGRFAHSIRAAVIARRPELRRAISAPAIKEVERLNPRSRHWLLAVVDDLIEDWPARFVSAAHCSGISARHLLKDKRHEPFAFVSAVESYLSTSHRNYSEAEAMSAKACLMRSGKRPTARALTEYTGHKIGHLRARAEPAREALPYGTHRYWKIDGVSPEIRAKAKHAAKRDGDNIGAWVEKALASTLARRADSDTL